MSAIQPGILEAPAPVGRYLTFVLKPGAEAGVPGYDISTWYGVWAPRGTPLEIVDRVYVEIAKVLNLPDTRERYAALGAEPVGSTPDEFAAYCKSELTKWAKIVRESGAKAD